MLLAKGLIMTGFVAVVLAPLHLSAETVARPGAATIAPSNAGAGSPARNGWARNGRTSSASTIAKFRSTSRVPSGGRIVVNCARDDDRVLRPDAPRQGYGLFGTCVRFGGCAGLIERCGRFASPPGVHVS